MRLDLPALTLVALAGTWACTTHDAPLPDRDAAPADEPTHEPPPTLVPTAEIPPPPPEPPPAPPEPEPLPPPRFAKPITPLAGTTKWREIPGMGELQGFYPFTIGVLAACGASGDDWCKLYDDDRLELTEVDLGVERVWGIWRHDAWRVRYDSRDEETDDERAAYRVYEQLRVTRWRKDRFKTLASLETEVDAESYYGIDDDETEHAYLFRKGWAGGMVVYDGSGFRRYPLNSTAPPPVHKASGDLITFFEAASGELFTVQLEGGTPVVRPPCPGEGPCEELAFVLPEAPAGERDEAPTAYWDFPLDVARGERSLTLLLTFDQDEPYLLHYDAPSIPDSPLPPEPAAEGAVQPVEPPPWPPGTWSFEAFPSLTETPTQLWPDKRGGVFVHVDDLDGHHLWYRDSKGRWYDVGLPGEFVDFANRTKPREFLALVEGEGEGDAGNRLFATRGPVRRDENAPPPSEPLPEAAPSPPAPELPAPSAPAAPTGPPSP